MGFWRNLEYSLDNFIEFNSSDYRRRIESMNKDQLRKEHQRIQRKLVGATTALGASAAAIPVTLISAVPVGIALRRIDVNTQRKDLIEARLAEKKWTGHDLDAGDIVIGALPGAIASHLIPGADHLVEHGVGHVATSMMSEHGANQVASHVITHGAPTAAAHHGAHHVSDRVGSHLAHIAGDHGAGVDMVNACAGTASEKAVQEAIYKSTHNIVERGAEKAAHWAMHEATKKVVGTATGLAVEGVERAVITKRPTHSMVSSTLGTAGSTESGRQTTTQKPPHVATPARKTAQYTSSVRKSAETTSTPLTHPTTFQTTKIRVKAATRNANAALTPESASIAASSSTVEAMAYPASGVSPSRTWTAFRILALLLPAIIHSAFDEDIFWFVCIFGSFSALNSLGRTALEDFVVPVAAFHFAGADYVWPVSIGLASLQLVGTNWILHVIKVVLYTALCFLAAFLSWVVVYWIRALFERV